MINLRRHHFQASYSSICVVIFLLLIFCLLSSCVSIADSEAVNLSEMSIEELMNLEVVTAGKKIQTASEAPAAVYVITQKEIATYGYRTLAQVVNRIAGFYTETDRAYSFVGVRGFLPNEDLNRRVQVLIDGHKVNDYLYGQAPVDTDLPIDLRDVDRIEVVKGPGSTLWGSEAILCVINCITKNARQMTGIGAGIDAGWYNGKYLSYGQVSSKGLEIITSVSVLNSNGQESIYFPEMDKPMYHNGIARNLDGEEAYRGRIKLAYGGYKLSYYRGARKKYVPTGYWYGVFGEPGNDVTDERTFVELSYENDKPYRNDGKLFLRLYKDDYDAVLNFNYLYPDAFGLPTDPGAVVAMNFGRDWARSWGTEARYSWRVSPRMSAIVGTEYLRTFKARRLNYDCEPYYYLYYDKTSSFHQSSYYAQTDYRVNSKVTLVAGSRWDNSSIYDKNRTSRFALVYNHSPATTYKFLYGEAFRSPSISEAMRSKNPSALRPEKIRTHELVWDQQLGKNGRLITSFYSYHMFDMIRKYKNIGVIDSRGIELQYDFRLNSGSSGYLGIAYMDAKSGNADYILPSSPKWVLTGGACGSLLRRKLDLAVEVQYVGDRYTAQGLRLDGHTITNLTLTSDSIVNGLTVSLAIRNLFNTTAYASPRPQNRITTVLDRIPQPERSVCLEAIYGI